MNRKNLQCQDAATYYAEMRSAAAKFKALYGGKVTPANRKALVEARRDFEAAASNVVQQFFDVRLKTLRNKLVLANQEKDHAWFELWDKIIPPDAWDHHEFARRFKYIKKFEEEIAEYMKKFSKYL